MKKSLSKILARMAKDGDVETVAEFIEEMIEEPAETPAEEVAEAVAETVAEPAAEPVVVEAPEATEITIDEESVAGIIERLDKLITLLTPAAGDEDPADPVEEVAEAVEEALEAAAAEEGEPLMTAGGGNFISGEVSRNEQSPQCGAATIETAEAELAEILETILEPEVSTTLEETEGDEGCEDPDQPVGQDTVRAVLAKVRPRLKQMSMMQRKKVAADIAAHLNRPWKGKGRRYDAMAKVAHTRDSSADLGKRIMAARNPHYHK